MSDLPMCPVCLLACERAAEIGETLPGADGYRAVAEQASIAAFIMMATTSTEHVVALLCPPHHTRFAEQTVRATAAVARALHAARGGAAS